MDKYGIERKYYNQLKSFFAPLTKYVDKYISENMEPLLRGDSEEIRLDTIPGDSFRNMIYNLENWLSLYMPDISEVEGDNNNVILTSLGKTANEAIEFGDKEFAKTLEKGINVSLPTSAEWWDDMKNSWIEDNYTLITSNAKNYVSKINTLTEQAIVNGMSPRKLKDEILKATEGLSNKHCKLLARDQMGKLNGQITESQMQEIGLDLYVWSTSADDRVRDSHAMMEGLLCRWDDASVCSYDNGKTWEPRPSGAVELHPGQDIQCRCVPLAFYPELVSEIEGTPMDEITEELPPVQNLPQFEDDLESEPEYIRDNMEDLQKNFNYIPPTNDSINDKIQTLIKDKGINPHYVDSVLREKGYYAYQYTENCQRCVPTLQMKLKGFDVTALPKPKKTPLFSDMCYGDNWYDWLRDKKGNPVKPTNIWSEYIAKQKKAGAITYEDIKNKTIDLIKQAPEGSMFELKCKWLRSDSGHTFSAFNAGNNGVIFYDPQSNKIGGGVEQYFKRMQLDKLEIIRTDDKVIDKNRILQCCKNK